MSDVFGVAGRRWLAALELPAHERRIVEQRPAGGRLPLARDRGAGAGVGPPRALIAADQAADERPWGYRGLVSAATFVATVGDVGRFETPRRLVSYVGLDPRVRQSGAAAPRRWPHLQAGPAAARHMLCEAAWIAVRTPGPLRPSQRAGEARRADRARRHGRKSACSAPAHRREDYAFGWPRRPATSCAGSSPSPAIRRGADGARALPRQSASSSTSASSPSSSRRPTGGSSRIGSRESGAGATRGRASLKASRKSQAARQA